VIGLIYELEILESSFFWLSRTRAVTRDELSPRRVASSWLALAFLLSFVAHQCFSSCFWSYNFFEAEDLMSEPPTKRARVDEGDVSPAAKPCPPSEIKRAKLWLDDGNIVLQAGNLQFRLLKSILASNSSFFRDMFSLAQPDGRGTVEGCPVIVMDDDANDLRDALEAMFLHPFVIWYSKFSQY
jgi:hypothetical protein